MSANLRAFERWEIMPRMLRDVSRRDLSTSVLGTAMPAPILLAPVGVQSIVHPQAELAVGQAAAASGHEIGEAIIADGADQGQIELAVRADPSMHMQQIQVFVH